MQFKRSISDPGDQTHKTHNVTLGEDIVCSEAFLAPTSWAFPPQEGHFIAHTTAVCPITWLLLGGCWLVPGTLSSTEKTTKAHAAPQIIRLCGHLNGITLLKFISSPVTISSLPLKKHKKSRRSFLMTWMQLSHLFAFPLLFATTLRYYHQRSAALSKAFSDSVMPLKLLQSPLFSIQLPLQPSP